jgi:AraC family transcriptional regulator
VNIDVVERAAVRVATVHYQGPFGEPLGRFWRGTVSAWLAEHDLMDCPRYGVCIDDPTNTPPQDCRYDACVELPPGLSLPDADEACVAGGRYAVTRFSGTAAQVGAAWTAFFNAAIALGLTRDTTRPVMERYPRGAAHDHRTGAFVCELCIPLVSAAERART